MRSTRALRLLTVLTVLSVPSGAISAQRYWHYDQGRDAFHLDIWLPFLKDTLAFKGHQFFTGAIVPSVRGFQGSRALATAALTGRYVITAPAFDFVCQPAMPAGCDPKSFDARTHHAISGVVEFRQGRVRPRATLRFPLDKDLRTMAGAVLGLGLSVAH